MSGRTNEERMGRPNKLGDDGWLTRTRVDSQLVSAYQPLFPNSYSTPKPETPTIIIGQEKERERPLASFPWKMQYRYAASTAA